MTDRSRGPSGPGGSRAGEGVDPPGPSLPCDPPPPPAAAAPEARLQAAPEALGALAGELEGGRRRPRRIMEGILAEDADPVPGDEGAQRHGRGP